MLFHQKIVSNNQSINVILTKSKKFVFNKIMFCLKLYCFYEITVSQISKKY